MRHRPHSLPIIVALGLLATTTAAQAQTDPGEARLAKILEGRTSRAAVPCIEVRRIITTDIVNGTAIVYRLKNSPTLYVNRPTVGLKGLNANNAISTGGARTLCEGNNLLTGDNGGRGAAAGDNGSLQLGEFTPWVKD